MATFGGVSFLYFFNLRPIYRFLVLKGGLFITPPHRGPKARGVARPKAERRGGCLYFFHHFLYTRSIFFSLYILGQTFFKFPLYTRSAQPILNLPLNSVPHHDGAI